MNSYHLGFPVKVIGVPLRSHDSRRWQNEPHLSVSLAYLRDIFTYLHSRDIRFYRLAGQLAPYLTHPQMPQFHNQIDECATELAATGDLARQYGLRLSIHPAYHIQMSSSDEAMGERARAELGAAARLLDAMGMDDTSVLVVHVGSAYGEPLAARDRFVRRFEQLPAAARARLALENDDRHFDLADALWVHRRTGVRLVFDVLHHRVLDSQGRPMTDALAAALATWPPSCKPKIHFSSPRTAIRQVMRNGERQLQMPLPNQHSDFIHPFEFIDFLRDATDAGLRPFDIMLEAKGKELALLRLREQIARFAPDLANRVG